MSDKGEGNSKPHFGGLFFYVIMLVVLVVFATMAFGNNYGKKEQAKLSDVLGYIVDSSREKTYDTCVGHFCSSFKLQQCWIHL